MDPIQQLLIEQRVASESPNKLVAYLLWFFLGGLAVHRFYLGKPGSAVLMILSWIILVAPFWWIVDAFLVSAIVDAKRATNRLAITNQVLMTTTRAVASSA